MSTKFEIWGEVDAKEVYVLVGWRQWADAGSISSSLPEYLIKETKAQKIGELKADDCYLFQIPGTHHLMRPVIKLEDGFRQSMSERKNEFYYAGDGDKGLVIFLGDEPHLNVDAYCEAFFTAVQSLKAKRVVTVAGVFGPMPYDKDRQISCIYSMQSMREDLDQYALRFSNYEGGTTIGSYMIHLAEFENIEMLGLYALVPAYDFAESMSLQPLGVQIEMDYKAWYDIMRRCNHMFGMSLSLADLEEKSGRLQNSIEERLTEMEQKNPDLEIRAFLSRVDEEFVEQSFDPTMDVWEEGLKDLFDETED